MSRSMEQQTALLLSDTSATSIMQSGEYIIMGAYRAAGIAWVLGAVNGVSGACMERAWSTPAGHKGALGPSTRALKAL